MFFFPTNCSFWVFLDMSGLAWKLGLGFWGQLKVGKQWGWIFPKFNQRSHMRWESELPPSKNSLCSKMKELQEEKRKKTFILRQVIWLPASSYSSNHAPEWTGERNDSLAQCSSDPRRPTPHRSPALLSTLPLIWIMARISRHKANG